MFTGKRRSPLREWAIPMSYAVIAFLAGLVLPRLEHNLLPQFTSSVSPDTALTILSSITSGMIALTGTVFSLAFVMVQFSAVAYSPRLVMWLFRDPVIWHSIGIFTATFLYAIGTMSWIDRHASGHVPLLSGWVVIVLMLASVAMFIALIQRLGRLQVNRMLAFTGNLGRRVIEQMYPPLETPARPANPDEFANSAVSQTVVHLGTPQALQAIDSTALLAFSLQTGGAVEVVVCVGDPLIMGTPLLRVYGGNQVIKEEAWRSAFETGLERTFDQDPKYALRLLVDIAIKALSPAINDPTTAVQALDQIQDLLMRLGDRQLQIDAVRDSGGALRLAITHPTWEDFLRLAFDEIRHCGSTSVQVMRRMGALISDLIAALPQERRRALEHQRARLHATIARSFADGEEALDASMEDRQGLGAPGALGRYLKQI